MLGRGLALIFLLAFAVSTSAFAERRGAGGAIKISARGGAETNPTGDRVFATTGHADLQALYGQRLTFAASLGVEVGAEVPAGGAYAMRLLPVGGALRFGRRGWIGVTAGVGGSGVVDRVPLHMELPVTAFIAFDLGSWTRVSSRLRSAWLPLSDARRNGSKTFDSVDEIDFELGFAIGERVTRHGGIYSDGTYVGIFVREQQQQRSVGVSIAVAMSGAGEF